MDSGLSKRTFRRGTVDAFITRGLGAGSLLLMHTVLSNRIGVQSYGVLIFALTIAGLLSVVIPLGWPNALLRFVAQYIELKQWSLLRGIVIVAYQFTFALSFLFAIFLYAANNLWSGNYDIKIGMDYAALLLPVLALMTLRRKAFQGLRRVKSSVLPDEVVLPAAVITGIFAFSVSNDASAVTIYFIVAMLIALLGSIWLWFALPHGIRTTKSEYLTRFWLSVSVPMVFGGVGQLLINRTDILMLGAMTNMDIVGLYSAAGRLALLNVFVLNAVNTITAPMLASAYHRGDAIKLRKLVSKGMLWSSIGALPVFLFMMWNPEILLGFFGREFTDGGNLLRILIAGQFVNAVTGPVSFLLMMTGREKIFAWIMAITAIINVLGNLWAIPRWGAVGAACITAATVTIMSVWQLWATRIALRAYDSEGI